MNLQDSLGGGDWYFSEVPKPKDWLAEYTIFDEF